jgi:hypothetical protein
MKNLKRRLDDIEGQLQTTQARQAAPDLSHLTTEELLRLQDIQQRLLADDGLTRQERWDRLTPEEQAWVWSIHRKIHARCSAEEATPEEP